MLALNVCVLACLALWADAATEPQVTTKGGSLVFTAADRGDIAFFPGNSGSLYLNGVQIKSAADLKGAKGDFGTKGDAGVDGVKGDTGAAGVDGIQGPAGKDGAVGPKGDQGITGGKGEVGIAGVKGDTGAKGEVGVTGADGQKGDTGAQGIQGIKGSTGTQGIKGDAGLQGATGPAGKPGTNGVGGDGCISGLLPSCAYWINADQAGLQANTEGQVLRIATGGMSKYYHPSFRASYTCKFTTSKMSMTSAKAPLKAITDNVTKALYYVVDCSVPTWRLVPSAKVRITEELVNVSVWFQGKTEIPFTGEVGFNQVLFSLGWFNVTTQSDGSVLVYGVGFNTSASFLCQFSNTTGLGASLHVNATTQYALNSSFVKCLPPHWNFTKDSRINILTQVKIFEEDRVTKKVIYEVPFRGTLKKDDLFTYYRCRDGVTNGVETDIDCGGLCPNLCPSNAKCTVNSDCHGGLCDPTRKRCGIRGQTAGFPAANCKTVQYNASGIAWIKWTGATGGSVQTYCLLDKTIDGGGWTMVWKHSYFEGPYTTRLNDMRTYSSYYQPCLGVPTSTGYWCNIPKKVQTGYTEQMVTAYHKGTLVYAYKAPINSQLGVANSGVFLTVRNKVYDICRNQNIRPSYSTGSGSTSGITFDKWSPTDFNSNCDTDWSNYRTDCRWENCGLPSSVSSRSNHVQMTMIIYVR